MLELQDRPNVSDYLSTLETEGLVKLPQLLSKAQLQSMQEAFRSRLRNLRWNDIDGYERTERFRHMVQDVLTLDQGFIDLALHPLVKQILRQYIGEGFVLCEAKGWRSLRTKQDFHGWHGDAWYDQRQISTIPREVKLAMYLTNVKTGAFQYIRGSHQNQHPRNVRKEELAHIPPDQIIEMTGPMGTAFLFDTSGVHRQAMPILEPREAVFLNYHDPTVPLQQEDVDYYRYHPLILNAAFLGDLSSEDVHILGFGNKTHFQSAFERKSRFKKLQRSVSWMHGVSVVADATLSPWVGRIKRLIGR